MPKTAFPTDIEPPYAEKRPEVDVRHGTARTDEYGWLRADNWQEMFKDPSLLDPAIRAHLEAENAYQQKMMADTETLRGTLFRGDEGPHQGGRFIGADERRPLCLRLDVRDRR